jgi:hypothetical protein
VPQNHRSLLLPLLFSAVAAALAPGCTSTGENELGVEPPDPEDLEGAADSAFRETEHGHFVLGDDAPLFARLAPEATYHAWYFEIAGRDDGATSRVSFLVGPDDRDGEGPDLDTVLYLYRQTDEGRWGRYVARNDDRDDSTRFSALSERDLAPGRYRVMVKGSRVCSPRASATSPYCGSFSLSHTCHSGPACSATPPTDPDPEACSGWEGALDECQGLHAEPFDVCLEFASIDRRDLLACCEASDEYFFCPVPEPVEPALLARCQAWSTASAECDTDGEDLAACGREHGFTTAQLTECCEADGIFYFCRLL